MKQGKAEENKRFQNKKTLKGSQIYWIHKSKMMYV